MPAAGVDLTSVMELKVWMKYKEIQQHSHPLMVSIIAMQSHPTAGADYAKFDGATQNLWHYKDGAAMPRGPYYAVNCLIELLRWKDKIVLDRIPQKPGETLPDPDLLNAAIPQSEWEEDFNGNPKGPWQKNYTVFLVNPKDGSKIICSNSTTGQRVAFENLKERVGFMRRLRGETVIPVIMLSSAVLALCSCGWEQFKG